MVSILEPKWLMAVFGNTDINVLEDTSHYKNRYYTKIKVCG